MDWVESLILLLLVLAALLLLGNWIAIGVAGTGIVVVYIDGGDNALSILGTIAWNSVNSYVLTAVPLFILMGELIVQSGVSTKMYRGLMMVLRRVSGGLLHTNILAGAIFSALSGSSVAGGAAIGTVSYRQMTSRGYRKQLTITSIAGGGALGQLIPPSIAAIIYGSQVQVSVADLFIAGTVPGIVLAMAFSAYLAVAAHRRPLSAASDNVPDAEFETVAFLKLVSPTLVLILVVLGSIYMGLATPTEAAALGASMALIVSMIFGRLGRGALIEAVRRTVVINCMVMSLVMAGGILSYAFVRLGVARNLGAVVQDMDLSPLFLFICLLFLYAILGCVIDGISLMLITLPVTFPLAEIAGFDPLWFGVFIMLVIEMGMLTPPVGMMLFVLKGVAPDNTMTTIVRGTLPVFFMLFALAVALFLFPALALWLPGML